MIESVQELTGDIATNQTLTGQLDLRTAGGGKVNDVLVNGTSVVENKVANVIVPTKVSDLQNDAGYVGTEALASKQDTLVSGTNIKTINNNAIIDSGDLDIPNIYFAKRTAIMGDSASFDATDLAEYNALCIKANKFLPIVVNENATTNDYFIYPYIRLNGKLRYTAFGLDLQGRLYKCYTAEKENPIIGQLTQNDLRILRSQSELLTTGNRFISYNPIYPYDPATKKYVDDNIGNINTILATLTTPGGN